MTVPTSPTDKRIDDLRSETHLGFQRLEGEMRQGFQRADAEMREGFQRVDAEMREGFKRVDADIRELRADHRQLRTEMQAGFEKVDVRFDAMQRQMTRFFAGTLGTVVAGVLVSVATALLSHS